MTEEEGREAKVLEAHQELVRHVEKASGMMRGLSAVTIVVTLVLAASYVLQLALPLAGTKEVTVVLTDPGNILVELVVLALALTWLYVGVRDYLFASRMRRAIAEARVKESEVSTSVGASPVADEASN